MTWVINKRLHNSLLLRNHITKYAIMKFIILFILTGLTVLSCKKKPHTERPLTADSIATDPMKTDTASSVRPMASPSDSIRVADSIAQHKRKDTTKAVKKKTSQK